jgi:hypothetical protein
MDERDMEEERKNREGKGWGTGTKMLFFGIVIFMFFYYVIRNLKARRANKAYYYSRVIQFSMFIK